VTRSNEPPPRRPPVFEVGFFDLAGRVLREVPPRQRCHRRIRFDADDLHTAVSKRHRYAPGATARIDGAAGCPNEPHDIVNELVRVRRADAIVKLGILSEHEPLLARHDFEPNGPPDRALTRARL
jgi:hypothetical protein